MSKTMRKRNERASARKAKAMPERPSPAAKKNPAGPPLSGAALEMKVAEILCRKFRDTPEREAIREESGHAEDLAIEAAIVSPRVQSLVEPVARAYVLEQTIAVYHLLYFCARALLESEKGGAGQGIALKAVMEISVERLKTPLVGELWTQQSAALFSSAFEQSVVENMLQLLRGQSAPSASTSQQGADTAPPSGLSGHGHPPLNIDAGG